MTELFEEDKPLPQFRKDLEIFEGPPEFDGSPTYNIYDPVKTKYFKITWAESLVFKNLTPGMTLNELYQLINTQTTFNVKKEELQYFFMDAFRQDLLSVNRSGDYYEKMVGQKKQGVLKWLLFNYLYLRIPLFNPDAFLTKTLPYVKPLGSKLAFIIYAILSIIGISLLFTRFSEFLYTFTYFFNFEGLIIYGLAITLIKIIHEFAHAYTAKNLGIYVPSMGIAFIVLWPVLYTDVTDSWKLRDRKERIRISIAGMVAELIIAGLCTIGWYYSDPGLMQSVYFVIASLTWISTLVVNLNPAIRFDGYYILMDLWGIDNLQQVAFSVTRWKFREWFLGVHSPAPESSLVQKHLYGLIIYSVYTFIYRIFLYTAIALFVYHKFTKALGVFLFLLEIGVFLVWPLFSEIKSLSTIRKDFSANPRLLFTFTCLFLLLAWFIIPLPHQIVFPAVTIPMDEQIVYVPEDSTIKKLYVKRDQLVKKGDKLLTMTSPIINHEIAKSDFQRQIIEQEISLINYLDSNENLSYLPEKKAELALNNERLYALKNKNNELNIYANIDGKLYLWDDKIREGLNLRKNSTLGKIANTEQVEVLAFISETEINNIAVNNVVTFRILSNNQTFTGRVLSINPARAQVLKQYALASTYQGILPVNLDQKTGELRMVDTYFAVKILLDDHSETLRYGQLGRIELTGPWQSKAINLFKTLLRVLWRESGV